MKLGADPAGEVIPKGREFSKQECRARLSCAVCLGQRRQDDVALLHEPYPGLDSRTIDATHMAWLRRRTRGNRGMTWERFEVLTKALPGL